MAMNKMGNLRLNKRRLPDFIHYDAHFFQELEQHASDEIRAVGLQLVM